MSITDYGVKGKLGAKLNSATPLSNTLAALAWIFPSNISEGNSEKLDFLGAVPALAAWAEARQEAIPVEHNYSVILDIFESSMKIPRKWIRDDKSGSIDRAINGLVNRRNAHFGSQVAHLINNAETLTAFDGVAFYSDSHAWGGNTVDNLLTYNAASHTAVTALEAAEAIFDAITALDGFVDDQGEPVNEDLSEICITTDTVLGGPVAQALSQNVVDTGSGTVDNPLKAMAARGVSIKHVSSARLSSSVKMQVSITNGDHTPFCIAHNKEASTIEMLGAGSDYAFNNNAYKYGVSEVTGRGYGLFTDSVQVEFN